MNCNAINRMDAIARISKLESGFNSMPNAISVLEDYYNINDESILTLDLETRKLIDNNDNDVSDWIDIDLPKQQPILIRSSYELLEIYIKIYQYLRREQALDNDWNSELFALIKPLDSNNINCNTLLNIWFINLSSNKNLKGIKEGLKGMNMNLQRMAIILPEYGFGNYGIKRLKIPKHSSLIIQITLKSIEFINKSQSDQQGMEEGMEEGELRKEKRKKKKKKMIMMMIMMLIIKKRKKRKRRKRRRR